MKLFTTTEARKKFSDIMNLVSFQNQAVGIGRRDKIEAILIKYPERVKPYLTPETYANAEGGAFDFLTFEPDIYTREDIKKSYV